MTAWGRRPEAVQIESSVRAAFLVDRPSSAIGINLLFETFFNEALPEDRLRWDQISFADMEHGHFGGLLSVMGDASLAYWVPAWLTLATRHKMVLPVAMSSLLSCFSPAFSEKIEGPRGVERRAALFSRQQKLVISAAGASLAGDPDVIAAFRGDVGASMQQAWAAFAGWL